MTIFVLLFPAPQPQLTAEIVRLFKDNHLALSDTQYLISASGTAIELTARLGIYDASQPAKPSTGNALIFATSSYYGRGPTHVWDWIKAKLEAPASG